LLLQAGELKCLSKKFDLSINPLIIVVANTDLRLTVATLVKSAIYSLPMPIAVVKHNIVSGDKIWRGWLAAACPNVRVVSDYSLVRSPVNEAWPVQARTALGQKSVRFRKSGFSTAAITSNQEQFTRFSRLQWRVL